MPLGLLPGAKLKCDVTRDQTITYDMVDINTDTTLYRLRALQDDTAIRWGEPEERVQEP